MGDSIRESDHVHIGVAVAVEDGLLVPVLRHVDLMSLVVSVRVLKTWPAKQKIKNYSRLGRKYFHNFESWYVREEFTAIVNLQMPLYLQ